MTMLVNGLGVLAILALVVMVILAAFVEGDI